MTLLNTTFFVPRSMEEGFLEWAGRVYLPSASKVSASEPVFLRILGQNDSDTANYAVQLWMASQEDARKWHETLGAGLMDAAVKKFSGKLLFFSTFMDKIV